MRLVRSGIFWVDDEGELIDGDDLMSLLDAQPDGSVLNIGSEDEEESDEEAAVPREDTQRSVDKPVFVRHSRR